MREIFDVFTEKVSPCPAHINMVKVTEGLATASIPILKLPSKAGVDRFSVNADSSTEFVTLYNVNKTSRTVVSCHSSICKIAQGSTRRIKHLESSEILCDHLSVFRDFYLEQVRNSGQEGFGEIEGEVDNDDTEIPATLPEEKVTMSILSNTKIALL